MTAEAQRRDGSAQKLEPEMHTRSSNVSSQTALEPIVAPLRLEERKHSQRACRQATMGGLSRAALAETRDPRSHSSRADNDHGDDAGKRELTMMGLCDGGGVDELWQEPNPRWPVHLLGYVHNSSPVPGFRQNVACGFPRRSRFIINCAFAIERSFASSTCFTRQSTMLGAALTLSLHR